MKDYLNEINERFEIRRKPEQKTDFFNYVCQEIGQNRVKEEVLEGKHRNIVIGDIEEADVIFTAHYDTPAASLIPNLMLPANKALAILYQMGYGVLLALLSLFIAMVADSLFEVGQAVTLLIYTALFFALFYLSTRAFTNKHNKNDNTSGVATVLSLAASNNAKNIAFVLFDNEEKGLLGSKAMNKKYEKIIKNKLVINFDCVGNGDQIIAIYKDGAQNHPLYKHFLSSLASTNSYKVTYIPFKKSLGNSDHKSFECSVGVVAAKKGRLVKFYTARLHTKKDTVASNQNVYYLAEKMQNFISMI